MPKRYEREIFWRQADLGVASFGPDILYEHFQVLGQPALHNVNHPQVAFKPGVAMHPCRGGKRDIGSMGASESAEATQVFQRIHPPNRILPGKPLCAQQGNKL